MKNKGKGFQNKKQQELAKSFKVIISQKFEKMARSQ